MSLLLRSLTLLALAVVGAVGCAGADAEHAAGSDPVAEDSTSTSSVLPEVHEAPVPSGSTPAVRPVAAATAAPRVPRGTSARVAGVVDGDTIDLADGRTVRLVQIDTPEVYGGAECGGRSASSALQAVLPVGSRVHLVRDPATDDRDRYDRLLRYVYAGARNINVWMVVRGLATPYFYDGEEGRFSAVLMRDARRARAGSIGLWGQCPAAVLDARRGVSTGRAETGGAGDARSGAAALAPARDSAEGLPHAPRYPPDVDCGDLPGAVRVGPSDPHRLDADGDGVGCDS